MKTEIITITPEAAKRILEKFNHSNPRILSRRHVLTYAGDMKAGLWQTTHQGIAFTGPSIDDPISLIDGQHRLAAIAEVGFPVALAVTFGAPQANKIDFGVKRALSIVTGIPREDLAVANTIVTAITGNTATTAQKQLLCEEYPRLGAYRNTTEKISFISRAPIYAAFIVSHHNGISQSREWYRQLCTNDVEMPSQLRVLRRRLEKDHKALFSGLSKKSPAYAVALRAIKAASEGKSLEKLYADSILEDLASYDGPVGKYVRDYLK